jgi:3-methylfumaryl-CoA hydratase
MDQTTLTHLQEWVGRSEAAEDTVTATKVAALAATLDRGDHWPAAGTPLPPLWHWTLTTPIVRQSTIGPDGHPTRGGFLPPVPLPRRMWAGSRVVFTQALRIGEALRRSSRVVSVEHKPGRSGQLVFVLVRHEYSGGTGLAITEEQDIVYREAPQPDAQSPKPTSAPVESTWERCIEPDAALLFRYSALTFNAHRIHYDRSYVTEVEGYPGLVVHGPLIATMLLDLLRRNLPLATVARFEFRAIKPLFDIAPFAVCGTPQPDGRTVKLWARDADGWLAMEATATLT